MDTLDDKNRIEQGVKANSTEEQTKVQSNPSTKTSSYVFSW